MAEISQQQSVFLFSSENLQYAPNDYFSPEFWQRKNRILGEAKGRGTTYFLDSSAEFGVDCALRHYYRGGLFGKFVRDRFLFWGVKNSRSFAEFQLLQKLHLANLPVPKPIAARVKKGALGICYQADLLCERIPNAQDLTAILQEKSLSVEIWRQIGALIRQLHDLQVCHHDLNAHNILVQNVNDNPRCYLIDFDKCGEKPGDKWKKNNLSRLKRSFLKEKTRLSILFSEEDWAQLLIGYQSLAKNKESYFANVS